VAGESAGPDLNNANATRRQMRAAEIDAIAHRVED
jgi:hypothetical protein